MHVDLILPKTRQRFTKTFNLYGPIDPEASKYSILGTKTEITLAKADARSWPMITAPSGALAANFVAQLSFSAGKSPFFDDSRSKADLFQHSQAEEEALQAPRKLCSTNRTRVALRVDARPSLHCISLPRASAMSSERRDRERTRGLLGQRAHLCASRLSSSCAV